MNQIVQLVAQKANISEDAARTAVEVVVNLLKTKLPAPIASQLDSIVGANDTLNNAGTVVKNAGEVTKSAGDVTKSAGDVVKNVVAGADVEATDVGGWGGFDGEQGDVAETAEVDDASGQRLRQF